jgi:hypothetical protein
LQEIKPERLPVPAPAVLDRCGATPHSQIKPLFASQVTPDGKFCVRRLLGDVLDKHANAHC